MGNRCHSRESGNLNRTMTWIPAFAGMTVKMTVNTIYEPKS